MISAMTSGTSNEDRTFFQLAQNHIYTVIDAIEVGGWKLIRIRNPWGREEYNGAWNDNDSRWNTTIPGST